MKSAEEKRMEMQGKINELLIEIDQFFSEALNNPQTSREIKEKARLIRIEIALQKARDCE